MRQLSELGNSFHLLCMLDQVLSADQACTFMLAAPLLGISSVSEALSLKVRILAS